MSTAAMRLRRQRLADSGLCIDCAANPPKDGAKRCENCAEKSNRNRRRWQSRHGRPNEFSTGKSVANGDGATALLVPFSEIIKELGIGAEEIAVAIGGASFIEIGKAIGVSSQRAQQICYRALNKLYRECRNRGINPSMIIGKGFSMLATAERWA